MFVFMGMAAMLRCASGAATADACGDGQQACAASDSQEKAEAKQTELIQRLTHTITMHSETEQAQELGQQISQQLQLMASQTPNEFTARFLESLRICTSCKSFKRLGELHDGGYLTCTDGIKGGADGPGDGVVAAYSLGVEHHDEWSADASTLLNVPIHQLDCTVGSGPSCPTCKFHKKCLRSKNGEGEPPGYSGQSWTFPEMLSETGQASTPDHTLLLKSDIEGGEWPAFAQEDVAVLKKFQQMIVEFHYLKQEAQHANYLQAMQKIKAAGFRVAHLHGNNCCGMYSIGGSSVPNVLEVTFIVGEDNGCVNDAQYLTLDHRNVINAKDLPPLHIPDLQDIS